MRCSKIITLILLSISSVFILEHHVQAKTCQRLISLAPSITQTVDYLELSNHLVGITRYCSRPITATNAKEIGGLLDMNLEAIYALKPDLILNSQTQSPNDKRLKELNITTLTLQQNSLNGVIESITQIGQACDILSDATLKQQEFITQLNKYSDLVKSLKNKISRQPKVLLFYGGSTEGANQHLMVAGASYHNDLLHYLGLENAYSGQLNAPTLSPEILLTLPADIIIYLEDLNSKDRNHINSETKIVSTNDKTNLEYEKLGQIDNPIIRKTLAFKTQQIYRINGKFATIPSPISIIQLANNLTAIVERYAHETHP